MIVMRIEELIGVSKSCSFGIIGRAPSWRLMLTPGFTLCYNLAKYHHVFSLFEVFNFFFFRVAYSVSSCSITPQFNPPTW